MKNIIGILVAAAVLGGGGYAAYNVYENKQEEKAAQQHSEQSSKKQSEKSEVHSSAKTEKAESSSEKTEFELDTKNKIIALMVDSNLDHRTLSAEQLQAGQYDYRGPGSENMPSKSVSLLTAKQVDNPSEYIKDLPAGDFKLFALDPSVNNAQSLILIGDKQATVYGAQNVSTYASVMKDGLTLTNDEMQNNLQKNSDLVSSIEDLVIVQGEDTTATRAHRASDSSSKSRSSANAEDSDFDSLDQQTQLALLLASPSRNSDDADYALTLSKTLEVYMSKPNEIILYTPSGVGGFDKHTEKYYDNHDGTYTRYRISDTNENGEHGASSNYVWEEAGTTSKRDMMRLYNKNTATIDKIAQNVDLSDSSEEFPYEDDVEN
ncbi:hypothetical protein JOC36_000484 [Weissella uvarum]|uniref:hypothetical protein n=1 Tax=Weissella uvarum TaxID=1479233 RepID=UPI00195FF540|nr:hypothetical protein [Weissella uvarum]MBM7616951.1 hypothetical protein [Weissella uvarum]MCM0594600.1 hypothetical protein [Weissella uvarum]